MPEGRKELAPTLPHRNKVGIESPEVADGQDFQAVASGQRQVGPMTHRVEIVKREPVRVAPSLQVPIDPLIVGDLEDENSSGPDKKKVPGEGGRDVAEVLDQPLR